MKRIHKILVLTIASCAALPSLAMPIGLRTAVWGVSASNGRTVVANMLPEAGGEAGIEKTLEVMSDESVAANIVDADDYEDFRQWAIDSGARADTLKTSKTAWFSFATASPVLVAKEIVKEDVKIESFVPATAGGKFDLTVGIDGVEIGNAASTKRLMTVFGIEGAATLNSAAFSSDNVTLETVTAEDGKAKFTAKPKDANNPSFFMRVKINP